MINQTNHYNGAYYHSFDYEMKRLFGTKVYKLSLDAGTTCPNRDGKCGTGGCTFCADSSYACSTKPIAEQIAEAKAKVSAKISNGAYIAYFQNHTNTYGDLRRLEQLFDEAIKPPEIVGLSIGTRPDCIDTDVIAMLKRLQKKKPLFVELGLQTIRDDTATYINRGYPLETFEKAYSMLSDAGLPVVVHIIIGLPYETDIDALKTTEYLAKLNPPLAGIKFHNLNILKGTKLHETYLSNPEIFQNYTMDEYLDLIVKLIKLLPKETAVHRITGDGPRSLLISPTWITDKKRVQNTFREKIKNASSN